MPTVIASSFADPKDVARYRAAIKAGRSERYALKVGDNGVGCWGDDTTREDRPCCALPPEGIEAKWDSMSSARGKKVSVTYNGITLIAELLDVMPRKRNIRNGAGIDLSPGVAKLLMVSPPFMLNAVQWDWFE